MNTIREPTRQTPIVQRADVCVIGGSCTGLFAAIRAARRGATVALVENNGFFGGVATAAMVNVWHSLYDDSWERQIIGGLTVELLERLERRRAVNRFKTHNVFNSAEMILELDEMVCEHPNIRPFLHTRFVAPIVEDGRVVAAIIEDKTGRRAIAADQFIDASGDGDLITRAGLPTRKNDKLQPPTMVAMFDGVPQVERANPDLKIWRDVFHPDYRDRLPQGFLWPSEVPPASEQIRMLAGTRVFGADCSDADGLTSALLEGRRQVAAIRDVLQNEWREGQRATVINVPPAIGIRETRHAVCLHQLTEDELLRGQRFDDAIGNSRYPVDIHYADKPGTLLRYLNGTQKFVSPGREPEMTRWLPEDAEQAWFYQIPYRCLVPQGSGNVLVAGRLVDADVGAYGAIRVMVNCNQMGEAAGVAATLALEGCGVAEVSAEILRRELAAGGSIVI